MENSNAFNDLFSLDSQDFVTKATSKGSEVYAPKSKEGKDNVYKSVVRFVAWHKAPKQSHVHKYVAWMNNPTTNEGFYVDCPSSIGKKSLIQDTFFKLWKSENVTEKNLAKERFSRKEVHYALVQIIKDPQKPELQGKILVFKFPATIWNMLQSELEPEIGESMNPFNPMKSKDFLLHIYEKGGFNSYEQSKFVGDKKPVEFDGNTFDGTPESQAKFFAWLQANSPDLDSYRFKEWDEDTTKKVVEIISMVVPSRKVVSEVLSANKLSHLLDSTTASTPAAAHDELDLLESFSNSSKIGESTSTPTSSSAEDLYADL